MLDSDLANLYGVETKRINEAVKNNSLKFPSRFSWYLSEYETKSFLVKNFDLKKYNSQYTNIKIVVNNSFHDWFLIIDNKILYHCGASFKDLGKKCFAITKVVDEQILQNILNKVK